MCDVELDFYWLSENKSEGGSFVSELRFTAGN